MYKFAHDRKTFLFLMGVPLTIYF